MLKLRPMNLGDILDMAINLYRENFFTFLGIAAVVLAPFYILMAYFQSFISHPNKMVVGIIGLYFILFLFIGLFWPVSETAITKAVSERFLERRISIAGAYRFVLRKFWIILGTLLLSGIIISFGMLFCIIPGILFILWFSFLPQVIVLEGVGFTKAMARSKKIFQASPGKTFLLLLLNTLILSALNMFATIFTSIIAGIFIKDSLTIMLITNVVTYLIALFMVPFTHAAITLLYYDIRIRKEGFDLDILAASLGYADPLLQCHSCGDPYGREDIFCGNCGKKLK